MGGNDVVNTMSDVDSDITATLAAEFRPILMKLELAVRRQNGKYALSRAQTSILNTLVTHGDLRMSDLARLEHVRMPTTSNSVSVIEAMGLVERVADRSDRRGVCVTLTPAGRARIDDVLDAQDRDLTARLRKLQPEHRAALAGAIPALHALIASFDGPDEDDATATATAPSSGAGS